jgi:hypothetical protein
MNILRFMVFLVFGLLLGMEGGMPVDVSVRLQDTAIVPQPKCEPTNVGLIRTLWTIQLAA